MNMLAVYTDIPELQQSARALAEQLNLPYSDQAAYLLVLTPAYLALKKTNSNMLPIYIDFLSKHWQYRRKHMSLRKEALSRAMGLKANTHPRIIDTTGGWGRDSFILACLGFDVTVLERSPVIYALLADGLTRAQQDPLLKPIIARLQLIHIDAITYLANTKADIIYLDPMFPERNKSAAVKKEMLIFQEIIGEEDDGENLFAAALACARYRVVVKRPRLGTPLANKTPTFSHTGQSCRFDVYMVHEWT